MKLKSNFGCVGKLDSGKSEQKGKLTEMNPLIKMPMYYVVRNYYLI